jgi:hypothetical protein
VACLALQYFSTLTHKEHYFQNKKKEIEHEMRILIFPANFSGTFIIPRIIQQDIIIYL